jgi:5-methylcytosine-specific restriction endonuclease McrA
MTEREVEELAALLDPSRETPRDSIRALPPAPSGSPAALDLFARVGAAPAPQSARAGSMAEPAEAPIPAKATPVRHQIKMTVGPEFMALLDEVRAELSHSHPSASLEALLAECMKLALAVRRKRSRAQSDRPRRAKRAAPAAPGSRSVPAEVRRQVWERDQGRCTFVSDEGRRCDATHRLELHHEIPFARGGPATAANVRVVCRLHNDLLARQDYGDEHMNQFARRRGRR